MSSKQEEELAGTYLRRELDEVAKGLGLDPNSYPNKRAIAEAIVMAKQVREKEGTGKEVEKKMRKPLKGSVKDKVNNIKQFINETKQFAKSTQSKVKAMQASTQEMEARFKEQAKKFAQAVVNMQTAIHEVMNKNKQYVKDFYG